MEIKPLISESALLALLTERFGTPITQVEPIATGQMTKGYFFSTNGDDYVIRFTKANIAFGLNKDWYAYLHFSSPKVPIPEVICIEPYQDLTYIITRKMPGRILDLLSPEEYTQLLPNLIETLDAIHQIDISTTIGYGSFYTQSNAIAQGNASGGSWPEVLRRIIEEEDEQYFYGKWHSLFDTTFLERDIFERVNVEMESLLPYCFVKRSIVHADFGSDNTLAENGQVTAVLDWANAFYGDFLYDVAWLDMWSDSCSYGLDINGRFQQYYREQDRDIPHYDERFRCCQCYIALDSFRFYAKIGNEEMYKWMKDRILGILE